MLSCTAAGMLLLCVEGERYRIEAGDVKSLIFSGRPAVVWRERRDGATGLTNEGYAAVHPAGRAVVIRTRAGAWIVPLVSFQGVARGEAVSAPLSPLGRGCPMRGEVHQTIEVLADGGYMM